MRKVYIGKDGGFVTVGITADGVLEQLYKLSDDTLTGNIYLGKVISVRKDVGVFLDIGRGKNAVIKYKNGLKPGDFLPIVITKEERGDKGCAASAYLTFAGRYLVFNEVGEYVFSRKISEGRKAELFSVREENAGFLFRTACEYADIEEIKKEAAKLKALYLEVKKRAANNYKIGLLYRLSPEEIAENYAYSPEEIVYGLDSIADQIASSKMRKIEIDGVELVFDKTEAMTVVDINLHKFSSTDADPDETRYKADRIALKEIARQMRLRNIGGIIAIDLISLTSKEKTEKLSEYFSEQTASDNVSVSVELVPSAGMLVAVRKIRF